jgi:hypothetical protein
MTLHLFLLLNPIIFSEHATSDLPIEVITHNGDTIARPAPVDWAFAIITTAAFCKQYGQSGHKTITRSSQTRQFVELAKPRGSQTFLFIKIEDGEILAHGSSQ